jgi:hypothetical protein
VSHFTEVGFWQVAMSYEAEQSKLSVGPVSLPNNSEEIQILRRKLKHLNAWPEAGDTFLDLLEKAQGYGVTLVPGDFDWLAQVADAAYKGEDIGLRYPSIFQKLLTYPDLRQKFLQTLRVRCLGI